MAFRVLIVAFERRWMSSVYLPARFQALGAEVGMLSHVDGFPARVQKVNRFYPAPDVMGGIDDARALLDAIADYAPDLVLPADDYTFSLLQAVVLAPEPSVVVIPPAARALLIKSLGNSAFYATLKSKRDLLVLAEQLGVRTPDNVEVKTVSEALLLFERYGKKLAVKIDGEAGGNGVFLCKEASFVEHAFRELTAFLKQRNTLGVVPICAQRWIEGADVACLYAAWNGVVVAGMSLQKLVLNPPRVGGGTIVAAYANEEVSEATRRIVAATGTSGLGKLDFMVDETTGLSYLLECNPRTTPITHIPRYWGIDLCAALLAAAKGSTYQPVPVLKPPQKIALFPQEWLRDRNSQALLTEVVDGPFDEPLLMRAIAPEWRPPVAH